MERGFRTGQGPKSEAVVVVRQTLLNFFLETRTSSIGRSLLCNRLTRWSRDRRQKSVAHQLMLAAAGTVLHLLEAAPRRLEFRITHLQVSGARFVSPSSWADFSVGLHLIPARRAGSGALYSIKVHTLFRTILRELARRRKTVLPRPTALWRAQSPCRKTYFWTKWVTIFGYFVIETDACSNFTMMTVCVVVF
jgi:hypothetical protein